MRIRKFSILILIILLALLSTLGITFVFAGATEEVNTGGVQEVFASAAANANAGWQQVNSSGFGEPTNVGVTSLEVFNGQLYAGASNWNDGGRVWRTDDGTSWTAVSEIRFGSTYTNTNLGIIDLIEFNSQLYAGAGWGPGGPVGQVWRSPDGSTWEQVVGDGFGDVNNNSITTFTVFSNTLFAATANDINGVQIWRSGTGDSISWTNVITAGFGYTTSRSVTGFYEFNNALYAAIESNVAFDPAQVWRTSDGTSWTPVTTDGFGDTDNFSTGGFSSFNGYLYLGTHNEVTGAQLWRSNDGTIWTQVIGDGFGDSNNVKIESLFTFEDLLYAITYNGATGTEAWHSDDGTTWRQVNADGFGNSSNYATLWSNASAVFNDSIFIGTWNDFDGGQVWLKLHQVCLPIVLRDYCADFFDDFSDPTSGWLVGEYASSRNEYLDGEYRILTKDDNYIYFRHPPTCDRINYIVEVDARWVGAPGASYGLRFGITGVTPAQSYIFAVNTDYREYMLYRFDTGDVIAGPTLSSAINGGTAPNHLKVMRNGEQITLEINGTVLGSWSNNAFTGMTGVGIFVDPYYGEPKSDVRYDNFSVTSLPGGGSTTGVQGSRAVPTRGELAPKIIRFEKLPDLDW